MSLLRLVSLRSGPAIEKAGELDQVPIDFHYKRRGNNLFKGKGNCSIFFLEVMDAFGPITS